MTTKEKLIQIYIDRGMFENEAKQVVELAVPEIDKGDYKTTWDRPASEYPDVLYPVMFMTVARKALEYNA